MDYRDYELEVANALVEYGHYGHYDKVEDALDNLDNHCFLLLDGRLNVNEEVDML